MFAQTPKKSHVAPKLFGHGWYPHYIPLDPKYPQHLAHLPCHLQWPAATRPPPHVGSPAPATRRDPCQAHQGCLGASEGRRLGMELMGKISKVDGRYIY